MKKISVLVTVLAVALYCADLPGMAQRGRGAGGPPAGVGARGAAGHSGAQAGRPGGPPGLANRGGGPNQIGGNAGGPPGGGNRGNPGNRGQGPGNTVAGGQSGRPENPGPPSGGPPGLANRGGRGNPTPANQPQGPPEFDPAFRNYGQYNAALHVSENLGIPFADLKQKMVVEGLSLGQAIQALRPDLDAGAVADAVQGGGQNNRPENPGPPSNTPGQGNQGQGQGQGTGIGGGQGNRPENPGPPSSNPGQGNPGQGQGTEVGGGQGNRP